MLKQVVLVQIITLTDAGMLRWNGPSVPLAQRGWSRSCFFESPKYRQNFMKLYSYVEHCKIENNVFGCFFFRSHENHNWTGREFLLLREWSGETTQNKITWTCLSLKIRFIPYTKNNTWFISCSKFWLPPEKKREKKILIWFLLRSWHVQVWFCLRSLEDVGLHGTQEWSRSS